MCYGKENSGRTEAAGGGKGCKVTATGFSRCSEVACHGRGLPQWSPVHVINRGDSAWLLSCDEIRRVGQGPARPVAGHLPNRCVSGCNWVLLTEQRESPETPPPTQRVRLILHPLLCPGKVKMASPPSHLLSEPGALTFLSLWAPLEL